MQFDSKKWNNGIKKSNQKWNNETCQCEWKNYQVCKEDYSRNPSTCICENGKYLKSVTDDLKIVCNEIINITGSVSTNFSSTILTNFHNKKVRYKLGCYFLYKVLLVIILLFILAIICYYYSKHRSKQKKCIVVIAI